MKGLFVVGLSHFSTPVSVRERVAVRAGFLPADDLALKEACALDEAALLATCSRFEVYGVSEDAAAGMAAARAWIEARAGVAVGAYLYAHEGEEAVRHLFRVAAGLDSWIVGETEILGQVKSAYQGAQTARTAGRLMNILFQKALGAGKAVRTETKIAEGIRSVGGAAAILAKKVFGESGARRVVVFGAGQMARTAAEHLVAKGVKAVTVANRTYEKAEALAAALGGQAARYEDALASLHEADIAIFSTSASGVVA
ncbi:MAG: glutamyl-tRNA reductase, partial [Elusimicrobia bacterium]|nr:glutamyl-tRNA reductase [Elusimicrobiota bacterium]